MWKIKTKHLRIQVGDWIYFGPGTVTACLGTIQFDFDTTGHPDNFEKVIAEYNGIRVTFTKWSSLGWWTTGLGIFAIDFFTEKIQPEYAI